MEIPKVVYQCSGCENPIRDGDKYVKTPYGCFCSKCYKEGIADYNEVMKWLKGSLNNLKEGD